MGYCVGVVQYIFLPQLVNDRKMSEASLALVNFFDLEPFPVYLNYLCKSYLISINNLFVFKLNQLTYRRNIFRFCISRAWVIFFTFWLWFRDHRALQSFVFWSIEANAYNDRQLEIHFSENNLFLPDFLKSLCLQNFSNSIYFNLTSTG